MSALGVSLQCQRSLCHYSVSARCVIRVSAFSASLQHQPSMFHCRVSARCVIIVSAPGYHYSVRAQCVITGTRCVITTSAFDVSSQSQRSVRRYNVSAGCVISVSAQWDSRVPVLALLLQCQRSAAVALFVSTVMMTATTGGLYTTISD